MRSISMRAVALAGGLAVAAAAAAQSPAFEVASVKPSAPDNSTPISGIPMVMPVSGGRFTAANVPLRMLVGIAYEMEDARIVGGPAWQLSKKFDITAKADAAVLRTPKDVAPFLKSLLADRFKLKIHTEMRELPVHVLVVARNDRKLGPAMKLSTSDCSNAQETRCAVTPLPGASPAAGIGMRADGQPISVLLNLAAQSTGKVVRDETGLTGLFDWELHFDPLSLMGAVSRLGVTLPPGVALPQSDAPSLLTAMQDQLGLKVESARRPVEVLVIDSAELPAPD